MKASLIYEGMESSQFDVKNGVKQGSVLAPVLFSIYFSYLIKHAFNNNQRGVYLHSRLDGSLFNVTRFQAKSRIQSFKITDLLFADDAALVAHSEQDLQHLIDNFSKASDIFSLKISMSKTVTMCHEPETQPNITLKEERLTSVDNFCYLGSTISKGLDLSKEYPTESAKQLQHTGSCRTGFGKAENYI